MTTDFPYMNASLPVAQRVEDLLGRMERTEKAAQLTQSFCFAIGELPDDFDIDALPEEHQAFVRQTQQIDAAVGRGEIGSLLFIRDAAVANRYQAKALAGSRLGIPLIFGFDVIHGLRTVLPVPIAQAASWDPAVITAGAQVAAREARASGIQWTFAPMIDIARDPRWGRIVESAGEDPFLTSIVAAAQVHGFQGNLGPESIVAGPKHFAGYGAARGGRDYEDAEISESELRNVYLPPFKAAIDAGAHNVMSAYMDLNGVPASGNSRLLNGILRGELGFEGFVVSDANAVKSLETQHFAADAADAAARAISAGVDMEMSMSEPAYASLPQLVEDGRLEQSILDEAVRRVLTVKFALGLFENPFVEDTKMEKVLGDPGHRDTARVSAERSIVLLKNDGVLPLAPNQTATVAVIGRLADSKRDTLGPWVFGHSTDETVSILEGIRARAGSELRVEYAAGVGVPDRAFPSPFALQDPDPGSGGIGVIDDDDEELDRAVAVAARSDIALVVIGERQDQAGETASKSNLDLPGRQLEMLQRIAATGTPVAVILMAGRPLDLRWADQNVSAIVQGWYPGTRGGDAIASVLFGDVSPAGRLPFTWPRHVGQVPMIYAHYRTFAPQDQDKRYWNEASTPLYPFGYGLSYGKFEYSNLQTDSSDIAVGATTNVSVEITNTSEREADEVAQLYIHQRYGTSSRPVRELKGFERVTLLPGETRKVSFQIGPQQLSYWSDVTGSWVQDSTIIDLFVGGDSLAQLTGSLRVK